MGFIWFYCFVAPPGCRRVGDDGDDDVGLGLQVGGRDLLLREGGTSREVQAAGGSNSPVAGWSPTLHHPYHIR